MKKMLCVLTISALGALPFFAKAQSDTQSAAHEKIHLAFETCREQLGLPERVPGEKPANPPSADERKEMDACLTAQGVDVAALHKHHHRLPADSSSQSQN